MDTFPRNLLDFERCFATEAACLEYVRQHKWPSGFRCGKCGNCTSWQLRSRRIHQCKACGHQESVTAGTMFHQTRKPLRLWFRAITLWVTSKRGISAKELSRQLGIHYETAWLWAHRLRKTVAAAFGWEPLRGDIDVDETALGGTSDRVENAATPSRSPIDIAGVVEVHAGHLGRVRLDRLEPRREPLSLFAAVATHDEMSRQNSAGHHLRMQAVFELVKRTVLGTFHGAISHKHLRAYLSEFQFRFNRRNASSRWLLFQRVIAAAPLVQGTTMRELTHNRWGIPERTRYPAMH